ncbi:MAG: hypothetical protein ACI9OJ_004181 [Myxococcota bacterium]|jgi:hypothetical protein
MNSASIGVYLRIGLIPVACALAGCSADETKPTFQSEFTIVEGAAAFAPQTCAECHPTHHEEWSGSMHAYAAEDPIFLAMNARGQRETDGALGTFCVNCHAPLAVRAGLTTDGLNLSEIPTELKGVSCYFCHSVDAVEGTHNNPLRLANDGVMRGPIADPVANTAHASMYSSLHDRKDLRSADMCGACHDIVIPAELGPADTDVALEETFVEWKASIFGNPDEAGQTSCGSCHMAGRNDVAADYDGVPLRRVHSHSMVGVDTALRDWPQRAEQQAEVQRELDTSLIVDMCVFEDVDATRLLVTFENIAAGHGFPSGATQDRRVWTEVTVWSGDEVIYESGKLADDQPLSSIEDTDVIWFGKKMLDCDGKEVHMFWEVCSTEGETLPAPKSLSPIDLAEVHISKTLLVAGPPATRVALKVKMRPMNLDVLNSLVESGDLSEEIRDAMPTFTLGATEIEWTVDLGRNCALPPT